jgi:hypothetical protein
MSKPMGMFSSFYQDIETQGSSRMNLPLFPLFPPVWNSSGSSYRPGIISRRNPLKYSVSGNVGRTG